jgi:hypothetical protein
MSLKTYTLEVGDDYFHSFTAEHDGAAADIARETAISHGATVFLFPGALQSGVAWLCYFTARGAIGVAGSAA